MKNDIHINNLRKVSSVILTVALVVSGFFVANFALAATTVNPASGGTDISIDTTSHIDCSGASCGIFKTLIGPSFATENGDIAIGTHTINLPAGWEFDTSSIITVTPFNDITLQSTTITPDQTFFSFVVTNKSTSAGSIGFIGLKVRPTSIILSTGNMTHSGDEIAGVVDGTTNFGTLSTVAGIVTQLAFITQPSDVVYGSVLSPSLVVETQDQFGNHSTSGLNPSEIVTLTLSGTGVLHGGDPLDIGTNVGNGIVSFTDLTVDQVGIDNILIASAVDLTSAESEHFDITQKPINVTAQSDSKTYDGTTNSSVAPVVDALESGDTVDTAPTQAFDTKDVDTGKTLTASGLGIVGGNDNYNITYVNNTTGEIMAEEITITGATTNSKPYDGNVNATVDFTSAGLVGVVPGEEALVSLNFAGYSAIFDNENVGTGKTVTVSGLSLDGAGANNYSLTQPVLTDGVISARTLTVTATGINRVYDATIDATVNFLDDRVPGDDVTFDYAATFADRNVGENKPVSVTNISIIDEDDDDADNYTLGNTTAETTADITSKQLTVTFTTDADKTYDGSVTADITGHSLDGVINPEVVGVTGGSATFADKHIGNNKTVTATGFTLTDADAGNYTIGTINTTMGNVNPRPITITAVTDTKIYNGTAGSDETPIITNTGEIVTPPIAGDDVANFVQTYDNKNVGTGKTLMPDGAVDDGNSGNNYSYTFVPDTTGVITQKPINVTAQSDSKTYDGTTNSSVAPVVDALESGDTVDTAPTQAFDTKDVDTGKTLTASGLGIVGGNDNYDITYVNNTTGEITAKNLTVSGATTDSKIYDGNVNTTVDFTSAGLVDVVGSENVTLNSSSYSATFDNENVGTGKTVTVSGLVLDGVGASNYLLTQPTLIDGVITQKTLVVTATGVNKVYDATTDATVTLSDNRIGGDVVELGYTAIFSDNKNVGKNKTVNVTVISITGGADIGNYILGNTTDNTTANITQAPLTATVTVEDKVYSGDNSATITGIILNGVLLNDNVTVDSQGIATFANSEVGNNKDVLAEDVTITGADTGNYDFSGTVTGTGTILPVPTTVYVDTNWAEIENWIDPDEGGLATYFGYDAFAIIQDGIDAVASGGTVNVATGSYGESVLIVKPLTLAGVGTTKPVITGAAENYILKIDGTDNVMIDSIEVNGGGSGTGENAFSYGILVSNSNTVEIKNSDITNIWQAGSNGIDVASSQNVVIHHNTLTHVHKRYVRYTNSNGTLYTNEIIGDNVDGTNRVQNLVNLWGGSNVEIYGNTLYNALSPEETRTWDSPGIFVSSFGGEGDSYANIHDNEIYDCDSGIVIGSVYAITDGSTADITNNNLHDLQVGISFEVIRLSDSGANEVSALINENRFVNNVTDINADDVVSTINAESNWWGVAVPDFDTIISGDVTYEPWYLDEEMEILSSSIGREDIYVDDDYDENLMEEGLYFGFNAFATIQEGIDAVDEGEEGGIVNVAAGIYNESVLIQKELTLAGSTEGAKPVVTGVAGINYIVKVNGVEGIVIDNLEINGGGNSTSDNAFDYGLLVNDSDEVDINNCTVKNVWKISSNGIGVEGSTDVDIYNSVISSFHKRGIRYINSDGIFHDNEIIGDNVDGTNRVQNLVNLWGGSSVEIYGNILHNALATVEEPTWDSPGIFVSSFGGDGDSHANIDDNEIYNCDSGIVVGSVYATGDTSTANITNNNLHNLKWGINFEVNTVSANITGNSFTDNEINLRAMDGPSDVNAVRNWWGTIDRTIITSKISGSVDYRPWCTENTCTVEDYDAPTIISYIPTDNAVGIDPTADITVTFDEAVNIEESNVTITGGVGKAVTGSGSDSITISPASLSDNTAYTITLTGVTDLAGNIMDDFSWSFTTAASYSIELKTGWNLISLPVTPTTWASTTEVLASVSGNVERVWSYNAVDEKWLVYNVDGAAPSDLNTMTAGYGYWLKMAEDGILTGVGTLYEQLVPSGDVPSFHLPEILLAEGWNLIGYYQLPGKVNAPIANALSELYGYWSGNGSKLITFTKGTLQPLTPINEMQPGIGYWIFMNSAKKYTFGDGEFQN